MVAAMAGLLLATVAVTCDTPEGWPSEKANEWYAAQPWQSAKRHGSALSSKVLRNRNPLSPGKKFPS